MLGPIFEAKIHDWEEHLAKLTDFWSSIVLMSGRYKGRPMPVHAAIPEISDDHFVRWLKLFGDTAGEVFPAQAALLFKDRAMRIAESLKAGIAIQRREAAAAP